MKNSKKEIKRVIKFEETLILDSYKQGINPIKGKLIFLLTRNYRLYQIRLMKALRFYKYYEKLNLGWLVLKKLYYYRVYAKYSLKLNCQINIDDLGEGFHFNHSNIVINKEAKIGKNLNCVGNNCNGGTGKGAPTIGNNVFLGYGAMIIGNVTIADDVIIGAGAIVTKDILEKGSKVVGINKILEK